MCGCPHPVGGTGEHIPRAQRDLGGVVLSESGREMNWLWPLPSAGSVPRGSQVSPEGPSHPWRVPIVPKGT